MDESTDLEAVARALAGHFLHDPPRGYLRGKTLMRDTLVARLHYGEYEAEELLDTLELQGQLRFEGDPTKPTEVDSEWIIDPHVP